MSDMPDPMTTEELRAAREIADAATPGPWLQDEGSRFRGAISAMVGGVNRQVASADGQAATFDTRSEMTCAQVLHANADFIAAARALVPRLLDEVARARAETQLLAVYGRRKDERIAELERALRDHQTPVRKGT